MRRIPTLTPEQYSRVAFWALFLVVLPYLYMVVESFHPTLPPNKRGGPEDTLTLAQYRSFLFLPSGGATNWTHINAFVFSIIASVAVTACCPLRRQQGRAPQPCVPHP